VSLAVVAGAAAWLLREPLSALPLPQGPAALVADESRLDPGSRRRLEHVTLSDPRLGTIGFTLSLPEPLPARKLPLILVLGGLGVGAHNLRYVNDPGDNAVIGYDWPLPARFSEVSGVAEALALRGRVLAIPGQAAAILDWLAAQPWSDPGRTSIIGVSLGAIAGPAIARVAALHGHEIGWTVLAYGGAPLAALASGNTRIRPAWLRPILGWAAGIVLHPIDPALHLPALRGEFLLLTGASDTVVSEAASSRLIALTPPPKTVLRLSGDHFGATEALAVTRRWLIEEGAVNPPGPQL
jgi:hypothetical protein